VLHILIDQLGLLLSAGAAIGSCYILAFAIAGSRMVGRRENITEELTHYPKAIIFIPAHNEECGIPATINSALGLNYPRKRFDVVVIADNCTDKTAEVAARCGTEVWIRKDRLHTGKGPALAWAFEEARHRPFDIAVIIDADTELDPSFLVSIARNIAAEASTVTVYQGRYDFSPAKPVSTWFEFITIASKAAENSFTYRPRSRAGLVNLLQGNGFCIPRAVLDKVPFRSTSVTEDADYAISLAISAIPVRYVEEARVRARMTQTISDAAPQRLRWASGLFRLMFRSAPKLLWCGLARRNWRLAEASVMLLLTSRLMLVYLTVGTVCITPFMQRGALVSVVYTLSLVSISMQALYVWLIFRKAGSGPFTMQRLVFLPAYIAILALTHIASLIGLRRGLWTRTVR
jgi:1,2-diacylglycerol 3-beta-glucosyltransferase